MVIVIYGSAGELIKLAPLLKKLPREHYISISTEQQPDILREIRADFNLDEPDYKIANGYRGEGLSKSWQFLFWLPKVYMNLILLSYSLRKKVKNDISHKPTILIHGDTVTSVTGALYAILNRYPITHVEAGLRSHDIRNPFPEEIDRRIITKLSTTHFAPGEVPTKNLYKEKARGVVVDTGCNTVIDSIELSRTSKLKLASSDLLALPDNYGIVSVRRNEFLAKPELIKDLLVELNTASRKTPLLFMDYPITKKRISELGYDSLFKSKNLIRIPSQSYFTFMKIMSKAQFIVTDSGGIQEECAHLNIPCLLHRLATERQDGIGKNVLLSKFDMNIVKSFLSSPSTYKSREIVKSASPTDIIISRLKESRYI